MNKNNVSIQFRKNSGRASARARQGKIKILLPQGMPSPEQNRFISEAVQALDPVISQQQQYCLKEGSWVRLFDSRYQIHFNQGLQGKPYRIHQNFLEMIPSQKALEHLCEDMIYSHLPSILNELAVPFRVSEYSYQVKHVSSYWGKNFVRRKDIFINSSLAFFPRECLRAVLIHEFCHSIFPNHSDQFYCSVLNYCPDYYRIIKQLDLNAIYWLEQD